MSENAIRVGEMTLDPVHVLLGVAGLAAFLLLVLLIVVIVNNAQRTEERTAQSMREHALETELVKLESRLQTLAEISVTRQSEMSRTINERLDKVSHRMGQNLTESSLKTTESLSKLNERLAVIDTAQKNITELSSNVVTLQEILSNKQQRGAYGQGRMEAIIEDALPRGAFAFQVTLSNSTRPDCVVYIPNAPDLVIDAKFPLEGFEAHRRARVETTRKDAARKIRQDVTTHISAIAERYLIPGETQDTALMFVPSEGVYAELHEHFPDILQKAARARVVIVSPNMLLLAVQTMQAIMKDVKMREQAGLIQKEVTSLMDDVHRLRDRVLKLQQHFGQAGKDIELVLTSSEKITARGRRIETLDFDDEARELEAKAKRPSKGKAKPSKPRKANGTSKQPDLLAGE
ncbi:MAG: DNA recombination protein RmuC [Hyphomicrobiales bacterium]|nr:DNA recombination protein RmuC [Hyphomicrobiales bacterium]